MTEVEKKSKTPSVAGDFEEDEPERGYWGNQAEFILSCIGYAVGLGNVWRFPYMTFTNGGGAFLIPYFIMLLAVGIPTFFLELSVGQYSGAGPMTVWSAAPLFKGAGIGMVIISAISCVYYNLIIAWSLYYMFASWQYTLPWQGCDHDYNTDRCYSKAEAKGCEDAGGVWYYQECYNSTYLATFDRPDPDCNGTVAFCANATLNTMRDWLDNKSALFVSPSEEYFNKFVLDRSGTIEETGYMKWDMTLCLLLAWIICFLCVLKGIKSSGKVVYFTATFPYLLLVILFFRAVILPGAGKGVMFYLIPEWSTLLKPKVWADAAGQIFFSLSVGTGGLMTFASYNRYHTNVYRDTLIVSIGNCLTSFFAGFVIFSILGFMATELNVEVKDVAASGSGLAFIAYPEIVTRLPAPQLWSTLFFFMLLTLGLDSQFAGLENVMTAICDTWPRFRKRKWAVSLVLCIFFFLIGLTQTTRSGVYWMELMSYYSSGWSLIIMGMTEVIVFAWVYGADKMVLNIEDMVGFKLGPHWKYMWQFVTPILLFAILIVNFIDFTPLAFGDYVLSPWAQALGWLMALVSVFFIPVWAAYIIFMSYKDPDFDGLPFLQRLRHLCKPTDAWRPAKEREEREEARRAKRELEANPSNNIEAPPAYEPPETNGVAAYQNPAFENGTTDTHL